MSPSSISLLLTTLLALSGLFKEVLPPLQDLVTVSNWMTGSFSSQEQTMSDIVFF
ncbi:hypothetical protein ACFL0G_00835 [Candidatus Zixiibacteriota bacterium]